MIDDRWQMKDGRWQSKEDTRQIIDDDDPEQLCRVGGGERAGMDLVPPNPHLTNF